MEPFIGVGIAQLAENPTEKPVAVVNTDVGLSPRCGMEFPPRVNFQYRFSSLTVSVQSQCAIMCIGSLAMHMLKMPNTGSHTIVWTHENTTH